MLNMPAWIKVTSPEAADAELAKVYETITGRSGVAHILQSQSLDPPGLAHHYALYRHLMYGPLPLTRAQREAIAVTVSIVNRCEY